MLEGFSPLGFNYVVINVPFFLAGFPIFFFHFYNYIITVSVGINLFGLYLIVAMQIPTLTFLSFLQEDSVHAQG